MLFSCEQICVLIGHRLQWALGAILCPAVVLFYVWLGTVLTKAELSEVHL